jgi:phosphopantothenoylcysteine synthetase/decarboxylase
MDSGQQLLMADVVVVAPATFNTMSKIAAGFNDNLALNVIHDAIGARRRVIVQPHLGSTLHSHPLHHRHAVQLRALGVEVLSGSGPCDGACAAGHHDAELLAALERQPLEIPE